ncbi:MAG: protein kinase [Anaerolineales bacterium]|jgi:serine/threonine-protein kinase
MEPQKIGRYEIKAEIGRGGMATVYQAYDPRFEREVALKVLPRAMLHDPQFRTRFEREAKTIAMLEHPAIVPVYDFGEEDGQPYFVMRYMTGGSLSDRIKKGPMTVPEVAQLFGRLAPPLDEAHAKGIIHRDLKPGNILFDQYGEPYISDFGIAKIAATPSNVTGSAIVGTPAYMSPEQAQGEGIDGRSDIYGLGVILFELLTGRQPYQGDTPMSVVVKHITDPVPRILDVKPDLPPAIESVIEKAMAKDRDARFPTVKALSDALNAVAHGETLDLGIADKTLVASARTIVSQKPTPPPGIVQGKQSQGPAPVTAPPRKKYGLWIGLGGAGLLVCVAAVAGIFILKGKFPSPPAPTPTLSLMTSTPETTDVHLATGTSIPGVLNPTVIGETPTPSLTPNPNPTPTVPGPTNIGGADLIAFLNNDDIWVMGVDGSNLTQITKGGGTKSDLQWSPDRQSLFYISGLCIQSVTVPGGIVTEVTCFPAATYLEAFEISPDGKQVAINLNRVLYVVPFDLTAISKAHNWIQLRDMKGCYTYNAAGNLAAPKSVRWSNDGETLAINTNSVDAGKRVDLISIFDISKCDSTTPIALDGFPATRFTMTGYSANGVIPSFDSDGSTLFVLNSKIRYELGYLYSYNTESKHSENLDPLQASCCYTAARFSPDGSFLLFIYQNVNKVITQLYYISYGSIGTGVSYTPLILPDGFFSTLTDHLDATLRPATP